MDKYPLQSIFQIAWYLLGYKHAPLPYHTQNVLRHLVHCKTSVMGGHKTTCNDCGYESIHYNSCRDRHCPCCQTLNKEKWIDKTKASLVDAPYYHVTVTVPHDLHPIFRANEKIMYNLQFKCVSDALKEISMKAEYKVELETGFICILHTWDQKLGYHPHIHVIFLAGGFDVNNEFKHHPGCYLVNHQVVAGKFKALFMKALNDLWTKNKLDYKPFSDTEFSKLKLKVNKVKWKANVKETFKNAGYVIEYLGRYTHRVAISNSRIVKFDDKTVTFTYKDRKDNNKTKNFTLSIKDFIDRFLKHILPRGFCKIRHYGILSNRNKANSISIIRETTNTKVYVSELTDLATEEILFKLFKVNITKCPKCDSKNLTSNLLNKLPLNLKQVQLE